MSENPTKFEHWALVELMGHQRIAGLVSEINIGGQAFLRVDVPNINGNGFAFTLPKPPCIKKIMSKPKDINDLRDQLLEAFEWVKTDPRRANQVKEMTNAAGKILGTIKAQIEYAVMKGEEPEIPFLGKTSGRALKSHPKGLLTNGTE